MVSHNAASGHVLAMSMCDLSFWCYVCDSYVISPNLARIRSQASRGPPPPMTDDLRLAMEEASGMAAAGAGAGAASM